MTDLPEELKKPLFEADFLIFQQVRKPNSVLSDHLSGPSITLGL